MFTWILYGTRVTYCDENNLKTDVGELSNALYKIQNCGKELIVKILGIFIAFGF
jgi:hypothetical protein